MPFANDLRHRTAVLLGSFGPESMFRHSRSFVVCLVIGILTCTPCFLSAQGTLFFCQLPTINSSYSALQDSALVIEASTPNLKKLMVILGGTNSSAIDYIAFARFAGSLGYDVIILPYRNNVSTLTFSFSPDLSSFERFHAEVCFGEDRSDSVSVDTLNSIAVRLREIIGYLAEVRRKPRWDRYLFNGSVRWRSITLVGHSQGGGHAAFLGWKNEVERIVMLSSPNDYSVLLRRSAPWLSEAFKTPKYRYFLLVHAFDETVPMNQQLANAKALGMSGATSPALVDQNIFPRVQTQCLYTTIVDTGRANHMMTAISSQYLFKTWEYLLTVKTLTTEAAISSSDDGIAVYPSPAQKVLHIRSSNTSLRSIRIFDILGREVLQSTVQGEGEHQLDIRSISPGMYLLQMGTAVTKFIKQ